MFPIIGIVPLTMTNRIGPPGDGGDDITTIIFGGELYYIIPPENNRGGSAPSKTHVRKLDSETRRERPTGCRCSDNPIDPIGTQLAGIGLDSEQQ
jgi:hypothetical protein